MRLSFTMFVGLLLVVLFFQKTDASVVDEVRRLRLVAVLVMVMVARNVVRLFFGQVVQADGVSYIPKPALYDPHHHTCTCPADGGRPEE